MGSSKTPAAPDYAAAVREGIETDIETLGIRNATNAAASGGKVLVRSGLDKYKTFDSMEEFNSYKEKLNEDYAKAENEYEKKKIADELQLLEAGEVNDFSGMGDADKTAAYLKIMQDAEEASALSQYKLRTGTVEGDESGLSLGELNALQSRKELEAADPEGYAARQTVYDTLNQQLKDGAQLSPELQKLMQDAQGKYEQGVSGDTASLLTQIQEKQAAGSSGLMADLLAEARDKQAAGVSSDTANLLAQTRDKQAAGYTLSGDLQTLLDKSRSDYELGGKLDDTVRREIEQQARSGQAARGNILGNSAAFAEAQEIGLAGEQRQQQRQQNLLQMAGLEEQLRTSGEQQNLSNLLNVMGVKTQEEQTNLNNLLTVFGADQTEQQQNLSNLLSVMGVKTQEEQTNLGNYLNMASTLDQQQYGREQQTLSSLSSFLMGNPVSNQFGSLAGAQFGTVGNYVPNLSQVQSYSAGLNANAGQQSASFALNNYSNQVAYADSQNPWSLVGGLIGAGAGAYLGGPQGAQLGASVGTAAGGKLGSFKF